MHGKPKSLSCTQMTNWKQTSQMSLPPLLLSPSCSQVAWSSPPTTLGSFPAFLLIFFAHPILCVLLSGPHSPTSLHTAALLTRQGHLSSTHKKFLPVFFALSGDIDSLIYLNLVSKFCSSFSFIHLKILFSWFVYWIDVFLIKNGDIYEEINLFGIFCFVWFHKFFSREIVCFLQH